MTTRWGVGNWIEITDRDRIMLQGCLERPNDRSIMQTRGKLGYAVSSIPSTKTTATISKATFQTIEGALDAIACHEYRFSEDNKYVYVIRDLATQIEYNKYGSIVSVARLREYRNNQLDSMMGLPMPTDPIEGLLKFGVVIARRPQTPVSFTTRDEYNGASSRPYKAYDV